MGIGSALPRRADGEFEGPLYVHASRETYSANPVRNCGGIRGLAGNRDEGQPREEGRRSQQAEAPGRLTQLPPGLESDGQSALRGAVTLRGDPVADPAARVERIRRSCRIGVNRGGELRYRFFIDGSPWVARKT